jgi:carbonic anhydrase
MSDHDVPRPRETTGQILGRLAQGNGRFAKGEGRLSDVSVECRSRLACGQSPAAAVLACSDSRVAPESIFDQGLGELFVVRVAGNVVDSTVLASLEYAVEHLGVRLILVVGHSSCGAVTSACTCDLTTLDQPMATLMRAIEPSVEAARARCFSQDDLVEIAARLNVQHQAQALVGSAFLREAEAEGKVTIQPAWYDLNTGRVEWL